MHATHALGTGAPPCCLPEFTSVWGQSLVWIIDRDQNQHQWKSPHRGSFLKIRGRFIQFSNSSWNKLCLNTNILWWNWKHRSIINWWNYLNALRVKLSTTRPVASYFLPLSKEIIWVQEALTLVPILLHISHHRTSIYNNPSPKLHVVFGTFPLNKIVESRAKFGLTVRKHLCEWMCVFPMAFYCDTADI